MQLFFIITVTIAAIYILLGIFNVVWDGAVPAAIMYIVFATCLYGSYRVAEKEEKKPIEFKASEYTLELKVTDFQDQKDTTYVLIPVEVGKDF